MQKEFERIKDNRSCGLDKAEVTLVQALDEIVNCELSWGAKVTIETDYIYFETKVFGDVDKTKFTGTKEEMNLAKAVCTAWTTDKRKAVNAVLLNHMGFTIDNSVYSLEDVLVCLELFMQGSKADELKGILTPMEVKVRPKMNAEVSPELLNIAKSLDSDDAIKHMVNGMVATKILDEVHNPV